jgi:hypothetical protein
MTAQPNQWHQGIYYYSESIANNLYTGFGATCAGCNGATNPGAGPPTWSPGNIPPWDAADVAHPGISPYNTGVADGSKFFYLVGLRVLVTSDIPTDDDGNDGNFNADVQSIFTVKRYQVGDDGKIVNNTGAPNGDLPTAEYTVRTFPLAASSQVAGSTHCFNTYNVPESQYCPVGTRFEDGSIDADINQGIYTPMTYGTGVGIRARFRRTNADDPTPSVLIKKFKACEIQYTDRASAWEQFR